MITNCTNLYLSRYKYNIFLSRIIKLIIIPNFDSKIVAQEVGPATNLSALVPVAIFLRDVNDNSPIFDEESYEVTLSENVTEGSRVTQVFFFFFFFITSTCALQYDNLIVFFFLIRCTQPIKTQVSMGIFDTPI